MLPLGATYDESLQWDKTTNLVCQEANEFKYDKAVEWKLKIVALDWIFHISQYG